MEQSQAKEFYTIREAASKLGVSERTIRDTADREKWKLYRRFGSRNHLIPARYIDQVSKPQAIT